MIPRGVEEALKSNSYDEGFLNYLVGIVLFKKSRLQSVALLHAIYNTYYNLRQSKNIPSLDRFSSRYDVETDNEYALSVIVEYMIKGVYKETGIDLLSYMEMSEIETYLLLSALDKAKEVKKSIIEELENEMDELTSGGS